MIYHKIESEHPEHHWSFLEVKGQRVLDLGCGKHMMESSWETTPHYFLNKGANFVVGVDPFASDIAWFNQIIPSERGIFFVDTIDTTSKVEEYINNYQITSLKMDIEGAETTFLSSTNTFPTLKHVAIETHNRYLFHDSLFKLLDMGFKVTTVATFYPRVYDICNLIFASRD